MSEETARDIVNEALKALGNMVVYASPLSIAAGSVNVIPPFGDCDCSACRWWRSANQSAPPARQDVTVLRDEVIAGLRERGWPEHGFDDDGDIVWRRADGGSIFFVPDESGTCVNYETADDAESGSLSFQEDVTPARIVEAIDRLRWVIGLDVVLGWDLACQVEHWSDCAVNGAPAYEIGPCDCGGSRQTPEPVQARVDAVWAPIIDRYMRLLARRGLLPDPDGPLVAMTPSKPAPKEDPPYVPTRWIGGE